MIRLSREVALMALWTLVTTGLVFDLANLPAATAVAAEATSTTTVDQREQQRGSGASSMAASPTPMILSKGRTEEEEESLANLGRYASTMQTTLVNDGPAISTDDNKYNRKSSSSNPSTSSNESPLTSPGSLVNKLSIPSSPAIDPALIASASTTTSSSSSSSSTFSSSAATPPPPPPPTERDYAGQRERMVVVSVRDLVMAASKKNYNSATSATTTAMTLESTTTPTTTTTTTTTTTAATPELLIENTRVSSTGETSTPSSGGDKTKSPAVPGSYSINEFIGLAEMLRDQEEVTAVKNDPVVSECTVPDCLPHPTAAVVYGELEEGKKETKDSSGGTWPTTTTIATHLKLATKGIQLSGTESVISFTSTAPAFSAASPLSIPQRQTRTRLKDAEDADKVMAGDQIIWPVKHSVVVEGDLVLGGLMMVHEREDSVTCGPIMPQGGIQALEAMLYTLDKLNEREIVPGVKIGAHILDDCDKDTYGLEMAVDFIKGSISNIDGAEYNCNKTSVRKVISGVVGAASSVTSIQVANLLRLFRIPQVSFFSTSPELSNKQRFEYFTRTIPSDHYQVKAMVEIIKQMNWTYVSVVYEESNYGVKAFEELESLLAKNEICIAVKEKLVKDSGVADESVYDSIVQKLLTKRRARGCIIYGSDQEVAGLMKAVRRCNATGVFSWIGSDGWSARGLVSDGNEAVVEGTLSVQPQANMVEDFEDYFLNLTVENNKRNPWFVEFWEDHFKCRYPNSSLTPYNSKYENFCTTKERLKRGEMAFENQLQFVSDAVMAFAYAFRDMHRDLCRGKVGLCDEMKPTKGEELLKYLRKVDFTGLSGDRFKFDNNGDGPARYNIIHFKQVSPYEYKWIKVGQYLEGTLHLNMTDVQFRLEQSAPPESVCSLPCELGQAKKYVEGESCCWHCFNCTQYQIRKADDETQCIDCPEGTLPDDTHSFCRDIPEEFLKLESWWAIGALSFSSIGILVTVFVVSVFLKHNDTPIVRASGRELSYVLLSGILLCYLVTIALVMRPTDLVCGIQRFTAGFCFTVVYAALLTKTNRISRIFRAGKHSAKRPSFISPRSQLIICSILVFVQILVNGVWMIIDPARAMHHYPTREDNLLVCNSYIDASYMIAFAYPIILIIVCTVYAVLTRKIPEAFNESKHIGFTMYTTCVIWLAFVPLYFGTGNHVALRITSMSVTISLSASVTIACLFSPKLYIILIRPDRNVRQSMMTNKYSTPKSSAVTGANASSMMAPITLTAVTCDQNKTVQKHVTTTMDCSTQSEYYEMTAIRETQNGKPKASSQMVSTSTQTQMNNNKADSISSPKDEESVENMVNSAKVANGPTVTQTDIPL